jgi:alkylation response protein AidB-like acyl-CoA dehydrogenase
MNFRLSEEELAFQKEMEEFTERVILPGVLERDENEDAAAAFDILKKEFKPRGYMGLTHSKKYGGSARSFVDYANGMMEVARKDISMACAWSLSMSMGTMPLVNYGTEEQREKWLRPLASGEKIPAFGLTEENAGSDSAMQQTVAVKDGDHYVLNGKKIFITNAEFAEIYTIIAMTDQSKGTKSGISAFIVEKGTPGFTFGKEYKKMGIRSTIQKELIFENCRIPKENLIGEEGKGFAIAMNALDYGRLGVACHGVGCAWGALDMAVKYSNERVQFGQTIGNFQAISFMLADMYTKVELAKLMVYKCATLMDQGLPFAREAALCKKVGTDAAMSVATDAVQIFGGKGFIRENGIERYMRDAKILQIYEGTNQVQNLVIGRFVAKNNYAF